MKPRDRAHGKIAEHFQGVGTITREMVVQRAKELALINGREHYTKDDFLEAKRELLGQDVVTNEDNLDDSLAGLTTWDEEPGSSGHPVERVEPPDEQVEAERLVEEGVSEAEHEQMVEGARSRLEER